MSVINPNHAGCRCCECQGKRCLIYHPGHSHLTGDIEQRILQALLDEARKRGTESVETEVESSVEPK